MRAARLLTVAFAVATALPGCRAAPEAGEPENAEAYAACQQLMRRSYEEWRRIHRPDLAPEEFGRQIRFTDLAGDSATVRPLGNGLFEVSAYADRPGTSREEGSFRGSFRCTLRQTWTQEGPLFQIGTNTGRAAHPES